MKHTFTGASIMTELQASPMSQILQSLGMTREDLEKDIGRMRLFLTENPPASRVGESSNAHSTPSVADNRPSSKPLSRQSSFTRSRSRANSNTFRESSPPNTPVKSEPVDGNVPGPLRQFASMEMVIERQRRQSRKDKKERREKERESHTRSAMPHAPSPSPGNASQSGFNIDFFAKSRVDPPFTTGEAEGPSAGTSSQVGG
ncbi:hypothetical protein C0991_002050 [Blastosporella zonata]|nr:hypothetical protein C0991_002050 [Blastosporella zonata]